MFRHLEQRTVPSAGQATICINETDIEGQDFPKSTLQVRVFNRDFVNESVFPIGGGEVPPIFVVGKEGVDKQKDVDRLKVAKSEKEADLSRARTSKEQAERDLDRHCTDRAKVIKDTLRVPGAGAFNEYDKRAYRSRAQQMVVVGDADTHRLDDISRDKLLIQHRSTVKHTVSEVTYRLPVIEQLLGDVVGTLETTVTSSALEALKDDPRLAEWTRLGLGLHKDRNSEVCLFCEQSLPAGRLPALEAHFSAEYDRFLQRVSELIGRLKAIAKQANEFRPPDRAALYEDMTTEYDSAVQAVRHALTKVQNLVDELVQALEGKRGQPFKSLKLDVPSPGIEADTVDRLNQLIYRHNRACADFNARTTDARERLALDMIAQSIGDYSRIAEAAKVAAEEIGPIDADVKRLSAQIDGLEREIVEHRQPAEELNEDLRKYLGHDELRLEVKATGYTLTRHGVPADSLSEGERTALALLYFLKSLGDRRFNLSHGVVVLDDPVSSLDANALYLAFGFIRQRTQHAGQLFLLTHNFTFFRQIRNWFHHLKGQRKPNINQRPARFYMLERVRGAGARCTTLRPLDPLLEQYESEYHYLFACVHREANAVGDVKFEQNYGCPNMARRLLEMFLAFRRPQIAGELWQKMKDVEFDEAKKLRIVRFVHTHSHGDLIGEPEHDPSLLGEAHLVLADVLEFMKSEDAEHFDAMLGLVQPVGDVEVTE